jgi:hypothetical protein
MIGAASLALATVMVGQAGAESWKGFAPEGDGFRVLLPGMPKDVSPKKNNPGVKQRWYVCPLAKDHGIIITVTVRPGQDLDSDAQQRIFADIRDSYVLGELKGKVIEEKTLEVKQGLAKELLLRMEDPRVPFTRWRCYVDRDTIRQFIVSGPEELVKGKDAAKFFDSIRITAK